MIMTDMYWKQIAERVNNLNRKKYGLSYSFKNINYGHLQYETMCIINKELTQQLKSSLFNHNTVCTNWKTLNL